MEFIRCKTWHFLVDNNWVLYYAKWDSLNFYFICVGNCLNWNKKKCLSYLRKGSDTAISISFMYTGIWFFISRPVSRLKSSSHFYVNSFPQLHIWIKEFEYVKWSYTLKFEDIHLNSLYQWRIIILIYCVIHCQLKL